MKTTTKKEVLEKAVALIQAIDRRRAFEKEEKELKDYFKALLEASGETSLLAGKILVIVSEKERVSLDNDLMAADGVDLKKYQKVTKYKQTDVKIA